FDSLGSCPRRRSWPREGRLDAAVPEQAGRGHGGEWAELDPPEQARVAGEAGEVQYEDAHVVGKQRHEAERRAGAAAVGGGERARIGGGAQVTVEPLGPAVGEARYALVEPDER